MANLKFFVATSLNSKGLHLIYALLAILAMALACGAPDGFGGF